jgi:3-methyladenine DNA glycosylase Tag
MTAVAGSVYVLQDTNGPWLALAFTPESDAMSKALKKRGFNFVGSTICYALMQATGMVNDHMTNCYRYKDCGPGK